MRTAKCRHEQTLEGWIRESRAMRALALKDYAPDDPHRLQRGRYDVAFCIEGYSRPGVDELHKRLDRDRLKYRGWGPFEFFDRDGLRPNLRRGMIHAWLVRSDSSYSDPIYSDFWRLTVDGKGYLLRGMEEDHPTYHLNPRLLPNSLVFDLKLAANRMTGFLQMIEWLGLTFSSGEASFRIGVTYFGLAGRTLTSYGNYSSLRRGSKARRNQITSKVSGRIDEITLNTEDMIRSLLEPVFSQLSFARFPKQLVIDAVQEVSTRHRTC